MSKRRRRRRRRKMSNKEIKEFFSVQVGTVMNSGVLDGNITDEGYEAVRKIAAFVRKKKLNRKTFFVSKYGDMAVEACKALLEYFVDNLNEGHAEELWKNNGEVKRNHKNFASFYLNFTSKVQEKESVVTYLMSHYVWTPVFINVENIRTFREDMYEGEDIFKYLSTTFVHYQFLYRIADKMYPDSRSKRHKFYKLMSVGIDHEDKATEISSAYLLSEIWQSGNQQFEISKKLKSYFLHTDVGRLLCKDIVTPYPAFAIKAGDDHYMFCRHKSHVANVRVWNIYSAEKGVVQLREDVGSDKTLNDLWDKLPEDFWSVSPESEKHCKEAFNVICNLLMYLQTENREVNKDVVEPRKKTSSTDNPRKLKGEALKAFTPISHVVYPSLDMGSSAGDADVESDTNTVVHWVRGHYRNQPYYPDGRDNDPVYKRIWIEPHKRGNEVNGDGEFDPRRYKV